MDSEIFFSCNRYCKELNWFLYLEFLNINMGWNEEVFWRFFVTTKTKTTSRNIDNKLTYLSLGANQLLALPEKLFENLPLLSSLQLYRNQLKTLPDNLLANNVELYEIDMRENNFEVLSSILFDNKVNLINLYLTWNKCIDEYFNYYNVMPKDLRNMIKTHLDQKCSPPPES